MLKIARADTVGSLLRPAALQEARRAGREGRIGAAEARAAEDRAIAEAVALQEAAGLDAVTDGEFRRFNFLATIGVRHAEEGSMTGFATVETDAQWLRLWKNPDRSDGGLVKTAIGPRSLVVDKIGPARDIVAEEYPFLARAVKTARPKYTFPAPSWHRIAWDKDLSRDAYPTVEDFLWAMRDHIRGVVEQLIALGCDYIHMDAPNYAQWHTDPSVRARFEAWGHDLDRELIVDAEVDNSLFDGIDGVTRAIHLCRGNAPGGRFIAEGGYGRIAEALFPRLSNYDLLLLEYDTERAGDFAPLDHVRDDAAVVLGLVTTKDGRLEDPEVVAARIAEAARHVPLERLALSPQCGFASGEYAATMTEAEQAAKLRLVGDVARRVWPNG